MKTSTTKAYVESNSDKKLFNNNFNTLNNKKVTYSKRLDTSEDSYTPDMKEKFICFSCYFTFGLSGLFMVLLSFINNQSLSKFSLFHVFQSLFIGLSILVSMLVLEAVSFLSNVIIVAMQSYQFIHGVICTHYPMIILCLMSVFAVSVLVGKTLELPGVRKLSKQMLN